MSLEIDYACCYMSCEGITEGLTTIGDVKIHCPPTSRPTPPSAILHFYCHLDEPHCAVFPGSLRGHYYIYLHIYIPPHHTSI
ncbi:hypothetical protein PILCRDRAFT_700422 [Piloderma croceum F 1598]|uniref:Uncharacterized protein n=1 Tax=Piloderma croceum (strain F 1598) TaxID=765440 RepID=A0A0C3AL77_PILCF|nr:hypothetical protein PILCRDRAFT_700422 [Piloderma croceum F 1598]